MKGGKFFIDTNVFLRIIVKDDQKKVADCEKLIELIKLQKIKAFTSNLVLAEIVWTLLSFYKIQKEVVVKILSAILGIKNLKIDDSMHSLNAISLYTQNNVKFIDCLISSNPQIASHDMKVVSYDKDFDLLSAHRVEPSEII